MPGALNPAWRGGHLEYRGENWSAQRAAARKRDNDTCQDCGRHGRNLPVHHITPFRLCADYLAANDLSNLRTLCPPCHSQADARFWREHPELTGSTHFPNVLATYTCERCGSGFRPSGARARLCQACHALTCVNCGKTFFSDRAAGRPVRFCSRACNHAYKRRTGQKYQERVCAGCGGTFTNHHKETRFCSQACHVKHDPPHLHRRVFAAHTPAAPASGQTGAAS